jgi:hypothetical protein
MTSGIYKTGIGAFLSAAMFSGVYGIGFTAIATNPIALVTCAVAGQVITHAGQIASLVRPSPTQKQMPLSSEPEYTDFKCSGRSSHSIGYSWSQLKEDRMPFAPYKKDSTDLSPKILARKSPTRCFLEGLKPQKREKLQCYLDILPVDKIITREEQYIDTHVPVYSAFTKSVYLVQMFTKELMSRLEKDVTLRRPVDEITWMRNPLAKSRLKEIPSNLASFRTMYPKKVIDHGLMAWNLISCNMHLFGNTLVKSEESTVDYWWDDSNVTPPKIDDIVNESLDTLNLLKGPDGRQKRAAFIEKLKETINLLPSDHGVMHQIFIPHEDVNNIAYIAKANGIADKAHPDALASLTEIQQPDKIERVKNYGKMQVRLLAGRFINPDGTHSYPVHTYHEFSQEANEKFIRKISELTERLLDPTDSMAD